MTPLRILLWDVESSPMQAFVWRLKTDYIPPSMLIHEPFLLTWAAKWYGDDEVHHARLWRAEAEARDDRRIVEKLADLVRQADILVAHNGDRFDQPKLNTRVLKHELEPLPPVRSIDTLTLARRHFDFASNKLDYINRELGFTGKLETNWGLWERAYAGEPAALREMDTYCQHDVVALEETFNRLRPYVKLPRMVDASHEGEWVCPHCGSDRVHRDGTYRTNASTFQKWRCQEPECRKNSRERVADKDSKLGLVPTN